MAHFKQSASCTSTSSFQLKEYRSSLEANMKYLAENLEVGGLLQRLKKGLPRNELLNIRRQEKASLKVRALVHAVVRNMASGAYTSFLSAIKETQPEMYSLLKDRDPDTVMDELQNIPDKTHLTPAVWEKMSGQFQIMLRMARVTLS